MTSSEHRARARAALKDKWIWAVLITLLASLLGGIAGGNVDFNVDLPSESDFNFNIDVSQEFSSDFSPEDLEISPEQIAAALDDADFPSLFSQIPSFVWWIAGIVALISFVISLAFSLFVGGPVQLGYRKYTLKLMDGAPAEIGDLFSEFSHMGRAVKYRLLHTAIEFVFTLPVFLVGIAAALCYESMGGLVIVLAVVVFLVMMCAELYVSYGLVMWDFILTDNPGLAPRDAMRRSWELMNGRRWDYWYLGLSFIGWGILAAFTFGIGDLLLNPYRQVSYASFYRELVPAPAAPEKAPEDPQDYDYNLIPDPDHPA